MWTRNTCPIQKSVFDIFEWTIVVGSKECVWDIVFQVQADTATAWEVAIPMLTVKAIACDVLALLRHVAVLVWDISSAQADSTSAHAIAETFFPRANPIRRRERQRQR